jgi:hypothetical protein
LVAISRQVGTPETDTSLCFFVCKNMGNFRKVDFAFSVLPNTLIDDSNVSWNAKGVYAHLVSKPDGWQFSTDRIMKNGKGGLKIVRNAVKELENKGYIKRKRGGDGRMEYLLYPEPQCQIGTEPIRLGAKKARISKKDFNSKKEGYTNVYPKGVRKNSKSMKYKENVIEVDSLGEPLPPREVKTKTPQKLIINVAKAYTSTFNIPQEAIYFKYKKSIEEMVNICKTYYGNDFARIEAEILFRIKVVKKYVDFKGWSKIKLSTIVESWNEIPEWRKEVNV